MIVAVDIGSVNLIVAVLKRNQIIDYVKLATPQSAKDTTDVIIAAIVGHFAHPKISQIIIGVSGVIKNNRVAWCSNMGDDWVDYDLASALEQVFKVPVLLENDANLAGLSEVANLAQRPSSAIYLSIGAGIGSSFIIDGQLVEGLLHSEAGMTNIEYDGVVREWETFASGKAIYQAYGQLAEEIKSKSIWQAIVDRLARGILVLIPIVQPEIIIIGGSMGQNFRKYGKLLNAMIDEKLSPRLKRPLVIAASQPELAVIYGAAIYAKQRAA